MKRKVLSVLMAVLMLAASFTATAFAEDEAVAKIGEIDYPSLEAAVAAVPKDGTETTVTLLKDSSGNGIVVNAGQNVVIDFGGYTYLADGKQVGSEGTENLSFQLLNGSKVTLKNGVITSTKTKMLVQNYCELVLEDITLDGTQSELNQYTLSNNFGNTVIKGATNILGDEDTVAFDIWYGMFASYEDGVSVTFDETFTGEVVGAIEYGAHSRVTADGWQEKAALVIKAGSFDTEFVATSDDIENANIEISGGRFTAPVLKEHCANGYEPATFEGEYGVCKHSVKRVYESKEKDCLENGYDKIKCTECDYTITIDYIASGHSFTVYTSDNNATFDADGTKTAICDNEGCNEKNTVADNGSKLSLGNTASITATQTASAVTLDWKAVSGAAGYRVYVYEGGWKALGNTSSLTYKITGLKAGTSYKFAVRAYLEAGDKTVLAPSYKSFTTYTKPTPPATVKASAKGADYITLSWSKCTGATGYRIYVKNSSGWKALKTTTALTYKVTGLDANTKYTFAVKPYVKYDSNYIWASTYTSFSVSTAYLDTPVARVATTAKGRATVAWYDVENETGYQVWYSTNASSGFTKIANYSANTEKIYKTGLTSGKTYYFKVRAYTKVDGKYVYSDYSAVKSLTVK